MCQESPKAFPGGTGSLMLLQKTVVSGHYGVRGNERPHLPLHLPPPTSTSQQAAFGAVWMGVVPSSPAPSLPLPSFCPLPPPSLIPFLSASSPPFPHPPSLVPLPSPPSISLSTSRRCKPLAGKLEGHPRKCKKKRHLAISQNIIS